MRMSRAVPAALVAGAFTVASLFAATPAYAATLPSGQKITIIDWWNDQFYNASPADASVATVGTPAQINEEYPTGVDVDDDGLGYAITTLYDFEEEEEPEEGEILIPELFADGAVLYAADANTGQMTTPGVEVRIFNGDTYDYFDECTAIDYTAGEILVACTFEESDTFWVGTVDPDTGSMGDPILLDGSEGFPYLYITAMAVDPTTGVLYLFTWEEGDGTFFGVYTLDAVDGVDFVTDTSEPVWGADFDRGGQLWVTTEGPEDSGENPDILPALATVSLTDGSFPFFAFYSGFLVEIEGPPFFTEALTVWGKETLPATGPANPIVPITAAAIALLAGAILAGATVLRRREESAR